MKNKEIVVQTFNQFLAEETKREFAKREISEFTSMLAEHADIIKHNFAPGRRQYTMVTVVDIEVSEPDADGTKSVENQFSGVSLFETSGDKADDVSFDIVP